MTEIGKAYDHSKVEEKIYKLWEASDFLIPIICRMTEKRSHLHITLPPPNVTGTSHMGHAFEDTIQDIIIRYKRMQGKKTLWLPGTDHAPIATESKVAKQIEKNEKKRKTDFERRGGICRPRDKNSPRKATTPSCIKYDKRWERRWIGVAKPIRSTNSESSPLRTAFKQMYDQGFIFRGKRIVNWDPKLKTTVSDDEVEMWNKRSVFPFEVRSVRRLAPSVRKQNSATNT